MTAKQLGLDESLAEFAGGKSPSHADEDEEQEEEEEEGEGEEQEEGEEEEEEQSVAERMSAEGLSFLTRLASELEEDENEPPRRRRPTGIPTVRLMHPLLPLSASRHGVPAPRSPSRRSRPSFCPRAAVEGITPGHACA